jgi:hypothetical protein
VPSTYTYILFDTPRSTVPLVTYAQMPSCGDHDRWLLAVPLGLLRLYPGPQLGWHVSSLIALGGIQLQCNVFSPVCLAGLYSSAVTCTTVVVALASRH